MLTAVLVVLLGSKADQFKLVTASKDHSLYLWQVGVSVWQLPQELLLCFWVYMSL
jgi:hypothetical protein